MIRRAAGAVRKAQNGKENRPLKNGDRSSMVRAVRRKLRALGFYGGWPDGVWGDGTEKAVAAARKAFGLPEGGVDWAFYQAIGLTLLDYFSEWQRS